MRQSLSSGKRSHRWANLPYSFFPSYYLLIGNSVHFPATEGVVHLPFLQQELRTPSRPTPSTPASRVATDHFLPVAVPGASASSLADMAEPCYATVVSRGVRGSRYHLRGGRYSVLVATKLRHGRTSHQNHPMVSFYAERETDKLWRPIGRAQRPHYGAPNVKREQSVS